MRRDKNVEQIPADRAVELLVERVQAELAR
jgi:hypothetical protein